MRSNCLVYAVGRWIREGGYLIARRSQFYPGPHFGWSADLLRVFHFVPNRPRKRLLPPIWFRGHVREWTPPE